MQKPFISVSLGEVPCATSLFLIKDFANGSSVFKSSKFSQHSIFRKSLSFTFRTFIDLKNQLNAPKLWMQSPHSFEPQLMRNFASSRVLHAVTAWPLQLWLLIPELFDISAQTFSNMSFLRACTVSIAVSSKCNGVSFDWSIALIDLKTRRMISNVEITIGNLIDSNCREYTIASTTSLPDFWMQSDCIEELEQMSIVGSNHTDRR